MMDRDKLLDALGHVDPALVQAADVPPAAVRRPWLRPTLVAACLVLVLCGTVMAVELVGGFAWLEEFRGQQLYLGPGMETQEPHDGFTLGGGLDFIPLEQVSQKAKNLAAEHPKSTMAVELDSLEAVEEFFGVDMPENPVMDSLRQTGFFAEMSCDQTGPTRLVFHAQYRKPGLPFVMLTLRGNAETELMAHSGYSGQTASLLRDGRTYTLETYRADNGLEAILVRYFGSSAGEEVRLEAWFALNGVAYQLNAWCDDPWGDLADAETLLRDVLAGYEIKQLN